MQIGRRRDLLERFTRELEWMQRLMVANDLVVLRPSDLEATANDQPFDVALLDHIRRYQLDTNDAAMLLEAHRAGIMSIATLDSDIRRAAVDFDVYIWTA